MNCNYKVNIKDIQNKYKFNIFAMGGYNDSDLRKMIESVFYALPRTTGTGTSVTLNDTAFSYMKNKLYATETSQKTTTGKNLCDTSLLPITQYGITISKNDNGDIVINGTPDYNEGYKTFNIGNTKTVEAGTYTSSVENKRAGLGINYGGFGGSLNITMSDTVTQKTATSIETYAINPQVNINYNAGTFNNFIFNPMFEKSSSKTDYEEYTNGASPNPDYPQVIHTITGNNNIRVCGKNIANSNDIFAGYPHNVVGDKIIYYPSVNSITYKKCAYVKANKEYSLSWNYTTPKATAIRNIVICDNNEVILEYFSYSNANNNKSITFTPTKSGWVYASLDANAVEVQLELGSSASSYEPYQSNSVLLTLGDKEICKIDEYEDKIFKAIKGNEVYDSLASEEKATLDYGKWYLRKNIGKVVLDGSENWGSFQVESSGLGRAIASNMNNVYYNSNVATILCDKAKGVKYAGSWNNTYECIATLSNNRFIAYLKEVANITEFKAKLSSGYEVIYALSTPTNEKFNDTIQDQLEDIYNNMLSYEGQTNVSQVNEDLPFNINSTALKDLNNL